MLAKLTDLENQFAAELRPATALEQIFASEIAYAAWELERVRAHKSNQEAAPTLSAAYSRASRNWTRARKELQRLQTARINQLTHVEMGQRARASLFPLADPARVPPVKPMSQAMLNHRIDTQIAEQGNQ